MKEKQVAVKYVKLQRHITRTIEGKEYYKWVITLPSKLVEEVGWQEGDALGVGVNVDVLTIWREPNPKRGQTKLPYEEFRDKIAELLRSQSQGLSWTEIKQKLGFKQRVPNNLWVRMMEKDIGLIRKKDNEDRMIWRLKQICLK